MAAMDARARAWFARRTSTAADWPPEILAAAKGDQRVVVILPALDEQDTVGDIVRLIRSHLVGGPAPLVDEVLVVDSGSSDATADVARRAGARVVATDDVLPHIPAVPGKGEAMWRGLAASHGEIVVFLDADLRSFEPAYLTGLLGPLLLDADVHLVKALYERPFVDSRGSWTAGGGRVTELVARPILNLHWPHLAGVAQPLAGEYAVRRSLIERLAIPCGYGVEFAVLVDTAELLGLDAIAQVDLGVRVHRHHDEQRLGLMAAQIWRTALDRLDTPPREASTDLVQFIRDAGGIRMVESQVAGLVRPPLASVEVDAQAAR